MRIWFDADNSPHVLVMRPIARELEKLGHEVAFTARDRASTVALLDLYGLPHRVVGGSYPGGTAGKALGTLVRSLELARAGRAMKPDLSFGHGSRALPIASRLLRVPSVTMYDYEWVNPAIFNRFCSRILLPEVIDDGRCREAGIRTELVRRFPGFKEQVYLEGWAPDESVAGDLGLLPDREKILVRPPARTAHYHDPRAEAIYEAVLDRFAGRRETQVVLVPRDGGDIPGGSCEGLIVPRRQYDGPSLIWAVDAVIGGGGTMTREAAVLGVPSVSFFMGRPGAVDQALEREGRLASLGAPGQVEALSLRPRAPGRMPVAKGDTAERIARLILG